MPMKMPKNEVMGMKEYTDHDEQWVMYKTVEPLYCTPKTSVTPYINYTGILKLNKKCL